MTTQWQAELLRLPPEELTRLGATRDGLQAEHDMYFSLDGETRRLLPLDLLSRAIEVGAWEQLSRGLEQRARALNALIADLAGPRDAVLAGRIPESVVRVPAGLAAHEGETPATVAGMDLLREADGTWRVLEDNLRVPSGIGYALMARRVLSALSPEPLAAQPVVDPEGATALLRSALLASAPRACPGAPRLAVLSVGPTDSAAAEHRLLAHELGVPLVTPGELHVRQDGVAHAGGRVDVLYRRIDDVELAAAELADGQPALAVLSAAVDAGQLRLCNALGCGVADDKAVYAFLPRLIEFYLGETPLLADVPTFVLTDDAHLAEAMDRLGSLVVKPVDGYGGRGVTFTDQLTAVEVGRLRATLLADRGGWIAQQPIAATTVPTLHEGAWQPCAVDLRAFVVSSPAGTHTLPSPLTRVAAPGSRIVNSSQGGGCKDTWILVDRSSVTGSNES